MYINNLRNYLLGRICNPILFVWICNPDAFVPLIKNICQHDTPTEPGGVKKINGESVKKALVPWYATGCLTTAWHFNAFSERH